MCRGRRQRERVRMLDLGVEVGRGEEIPAI